MILAIAGLIVGLVLGAFCPILVPLGYTRFFAVGLLAALDSVFGGLRALSDGGFDTSVFISGFFMNAILAALLVFVGDKLSIDLYYVALFTFGFRIFQNLAIRRRIFLSKKEK